GLGPLPGEPLLLAAGERGEEGPEPVLQPGDVALLLGERGLALADERATLADARVEHGPLAGEALEAPHVLPKRADVVVRPGPAVGSGGVEIGHVTRDVRAAPNVPSRLPPDAAPPDRREPRDHLERDELLLRDELEVAQERLDLLHRPRVEAGCGGGVDLAHRRDVALPRRPADHVGDAEVAARRDRSEEHTSELQSRENLVCRLLLE